MLNLMTLPFGMITFGRSWEIGSDYRYGFNGKESDSETYGDGNIYDYGFRIYNPRLGKFLSVDPLTESYPWYSPYQFAGNNPIWRIDIDGLEEGPSEANSEIGSDPNVTSEGAQEEIYTLPEFTIYAYPSLESFNYFDPIKYNKINIAENTYMYIPNLNIEKYTIKEPDLTEPNAPYHVRMMMGQGELSVSAIAGLEGSIQTLNVPSSMDVWEVGRTMKRLSLDGGTSSSIGIEMSMGAGAMNIFAFEGQSVTNFLNQDMRENDYSIGGSYVLGGDYTFGEAFLNGTSDRLYNYHLFSFTLGFGVDYGIPGDPSFNGMQGIASTGWYVDPPLTRNDSLSIAKYLSENAKSAFSRNYFSNYGK